MNRGVKGRAEKSQLSLRRKILHKSSLLTVMRPLCLWPGYLSLKSGELDCKLGWARKLSAEGGERSSICIES